MKGPYSEADYAELWRVLNQKGTTQIDQGGFRSLIEVPSMAFVARSLRTRKHPLPPAPSIQEQDLEFIENRLKEIIRMLPKQNPGEWVYESLIGAAHELADARHGITPPHVSPRRLELTEVPNPPPGDEALRDHWSMDEAYGNMRQHLDWIASVARRARERSNKAKALYGKKVPDEANQNYHKTLEFIFEKATGRKAIAEPTWFGIFATAAFARLVPNMTPKAIEGLLRRNKPQSS
jgi:hypothetical protein